MYSGSFQVRNRNPDSENNKNLCGCRELHWHIVHLSDVNKRFALGIVSVNMVPHSRAVSSMHTELD